MSAISTRGDLHFTVFHDKSNADAMIRFLQRLIKDWPADQIELHVLPPYASHLNPDELVNADLKRTLADRVITDRDQMEFAVHSFLHRVQNRGPQRTAPRPAPRHRFSLPQYAPSRAGPRRSRWSRRLPR
jgi:hypothetical protein